MTKLREYDCKIYRREVYIAHETIKAASPEKAFEKLEQLENEGELDFSDYGGDADPGERFIITDETGNEYEKETIDLRFNIYGRDLLEKANAVVSLWATSQLAPAVRDLDAVLQLILADEPLQDSPLSVAV
jgi:hypothetical protein